MKREAILKKKFLIVLGIITITSLCACSKSAVEADKYEQTYASEQTEATQEENETEESDQTEEVSSVSNENEESMGSAEDETEDKLKEVLETKAEITEEKIRLFDMDDFDNNGEYEAFALVGEEPEYDFDEEGIVAGDVWFINGKDATKLTDQYGMGFQCKDRILDFGITKYVIFADEYATGVMTYAFEVKGNDVEEAPFSKCGAVQVTDQEDDCFRIVDSSYDAEYDPELDSTLGHTWKSYYFYYDRDTDSVKEYGGSEITDEKAKELAGRDLAAECVKSDDTLESIYYRKNGIININYSRPGENGCISYLHRTWDIEKECYIDDYTEASDEEQAGTYLPALCPEIATY